MNNNTSMAQAADDVTINHGKTRIALINNAGFHEIVARVAVAWDGTNDEALYILTPQDARDAASALSEAANRLEELEAVAKGLRIFDIDASPYWEGRLRAETFVIGLQTTTETGATRLFRIADDGTHKVGDTWGSEVDKRDKHGRPEFFQEIIARATYLSSYVDNDGWNVHRYVEVTD
ncbi:MAG: hypothetical protein JWP85_978 [Rhodoglobus sp.]|nr:hypothetical protein [Rhodoglobus sp.]